MYFKEWAMKRRVHDTPNGDFIRDLRYDIKFPSTNNRQEMLNYLYTSCDGAKEAFNYWYSLFLKDVGVHGINEWITHKCVVCGKEFLCCAVDGEINETIKHQRPTGEIERSRLVTFFSHWNRTRGILMPDKSVCFSCYCNERLNQDSKYIRPGYSYFYPDGWNNHF